MALTALAAVLLATTGRAWRDAAARRRVITIAAREYAERFGAPPPSSTTYLPGGVVQVAYVNVNWESEQREHIVEFRVQCIVNNKRDFHGRPIPYKSGYTVSQRFSVKDNEDCEYVGMKSGGAY